jgi:uncharacterized protein (TIGR02391 family)
MSVSDKLRTLAGETGDGTKLVDVLCFPAAAPRVRFNALATERERSEQTGIATLMKGMFSTFRNPAAHAPKVAWATSRSDALDMLTLASILHRRLDKADVRQAAVGSGQRTDSYLKLPVVFRPHSTALPHTSRS